MLWLMLAVLVIVAGAMLRRRPPNGVEDEPWRASLDSADEGGLDMEAIRKAEDEWLSDSGWSDDEGWDEGQATEDAWR